VTRVKKKEIKKGGEPTLYHDRKKKKESVEKEGEKISNALNAGRINWKLTTKEKRKKRGQTAEELALIGGGRGAQTLRSKKNDYGTIKEADQRVKPVRGAMSLGKNQMKTGPREKSTQKRGEREKTKTGCYSRMKKDGILGGRQ